MKAEHFIQSLLPDFDKERINEDTRITKEELLRYTLPAYDKAVPFVRTWEFKSQRVVKLSSIFKLNVKGGRGNFIESIYEGLRLLSNNLDEAKDLIDKSFGDDIIGQGLTYYKANLLQYIEAVNFVSRFSRRLLNFVYVAETAEYENQEAIEEAISPADAEWVEANFPNFCAAFKAVANKTSDIKTQLDQVPDILVKVGEQDKLEASVGKGKLDPLQMGFIPVSLNPIFHVRLAIATWQTNRYHAAKQEIKCLQLRKDHLQSLSQGKPDANTQKQINNLEDRIQGLLRANAQMEAKYG